MRERILDTRSTGGRPAFDREAFEHAVGVYLVREFVPAVVTILNEAIAPLRAELVALKAAAAELRGQIAVLRKSGVHYRDLWEDGTEYSEGDCVVSGGSLWRANATTTFKPGQSTDWRLICRKGRDARDAANGRAHPS